MSLDRIKYYGKFDMATGYSLQQAEAFIDSYDESKVSENINEILELYNVWMLIDSGIKLKTWTDAKVEEMRQATASYIKYVRMLFNNINDDNITGFVESIDVLYDDDFWLLFSKYKIFKKISPKRFDELLRKNTSQLWRILMYKEIVDYYDVELAGICRSTIQCAELLMTQYLSEHKKKYYFPKSLSPSDYESIIERYINSENANPNYLILLEKAQSSKEFPISDKLRLAAKNAFQKFWVEHSDHCSGIESSICVTFEELTDIVKVEQNGECSFIIAYDKKWIENNLDYPTLLNNFLYLFEYADLLFRSRIVSVKSKISPLESIIGIRGNKEFLIGSSFHQIEMLSSVQMFAYYDILKKHDIHLENIIQWYFEKYIDKEFGVKGFVFNPPSCETNYIEKCRTISSEMDGVLKQFRMYIEDGEINRELFEMSSEHIVFSSLKSGIRWKYAYSESDELKREQFLLFSDQSGIFFTEKHKSRYRSFYDLIQAEPVCIDDFYEYQRISITWLINRGTITMNVDGHLVLNNQRVVILKDLYDHDVICLQHYAPLAELVRSLMNSGDLRAADTLFSEPEQDYLNYKLNKSKFSNGLDLRNKYAHSTYPRDERTQMMDYIELLKVMIIIIIKIQDELLLMERKRQEKQVLFD